MEDLYELKRELLLLEGAITPVIDICNELMRLHKRGYSQGSTGVFSRYRRSLQTAIDRTIHGNARDVNCGNAGTSDFETVRQNEVVKRLAGWGAILAIPTMVFSWYGMNFSTCGAGWDTAIRWWSRVALGSLLLYWRLKRAGWL